MEITLVLQVPPTVTGYLADGFPARLTESRRLERLRL
jgi:hypothetical protein